MEAEAAPLAAPAPEVAHKPAPAPAVYEAPIPMGYIAGTDVDAFIRER